MYTHRSARLFVHESETDNRLCHLIQNHNVLVFKIHACVFTNGFYEA